MSYSQFGYTYPSSSQILVSGPGPMSPCCQPSGGVPESGHGSPPQTAAVCNLSAAYDSRLLSSFPRLATGFGLYGSSYAEQGYISTLAGTNPSAFYSSLPSPYDLKESRTTWTALQQTPTPGCYPYDPSGLASCGPYADRYSSIDSVARRKNATRETTNTLKAWLYEHRKNPYPTKGEKIMLAIITKMTLTQVSTWFANARRRLKKENKMTWEPRNKTSEGDDRDSSSPRDIKSDDNTEDCTDSNLPDFLKQEPGTFANKHDFSTQFEDGRVESKPQSQPGKECLSFGMDCYRVQAHSSEDSVTSESPSPARTLSLQNSCYGATQSTFEPMKGDQKDSIFCPADETGPSFGSAPSNNRPKIWSLARTATSDSPPLIRRSLFPCHVEFCSESGQKEEDNSATGKVKSTPLASGSCSLHYANFTPDRTSGVAMRKHPVDDMCCDRSMYSLLPSCGVQAKCETTDCITTGNRGSCMMDNQTHYATTEFPTNLVERSEHYTYEGKQFKKDVSAMCFPPVKCQSIDSSDVGTQNSTPEKLTTPHPSGLLQYSDGDTATRTEFFRGGTFNQTLQEETVHECHTVHKSTTNQDVSTPNQMIDAGPLLRRDDC